MKAFAGDVEDLLRWLNNFRGELKTSEPMGALPDTAQHQFDKFLVCIQAVLNSGTELINTVTCLRVMMKHSEGVIKSCDTPDLCIISF